MKVEDLKKHKDNLYSSLSRDLSEFEKNFLLVSSGILAFSITFINEIVKVENADCISFLFLSWFFIILSIGLMMYTFLHSASSCDQLWKITDDFIINNNLFDETQVLNSDLATSFKNTINYTYYRSKKHLRILRYLAISLFIIGISCLAIFVSINIIKENKQDSTNYESKLPSSRYIVNGCNESTILINNSHENDFTNSMPIFYSKTKPKSN